MYTEFNISHFQPNIRSVQFLNGKKVLHTLTSVIIALLLKSTKSVEES